MSSILILQGDLNFDLNRNILVQKKGKKILKLIDTRAQWHIPSTVNEVVKIAKQMHILISSPENSSKLFYFAFTRQLLQRSM